MMLLHDRATMERALTLDLDPRPTDVLRARIEHTLANDLADDTEILVVAAGDTEFDIGGRSGSRRWSSRSTASGTGSPGSRPASIGSPTSAAGSSSYARSARHSR